MSHDVSLLISSLKGLVGHWKYAPFFIEILSQDSYSQEQLDTLITVLKEAMEEVVSLSSQEQFQDLLSMASTLRKQEFEDKKYDIARATADMDVIGQQSKNVRSHEKFGSNHQFARG